MQNFVSDGFALANLFARFGAVVVGDLVSVEVVDRLFMNAAQELAVRIVNGAAAALESDFFDRFRRQ